jgi:Rrf2 family protein
LTKLLHFVIVLAGDRMKISTRGRYALRSMVDVALHGEERPVLRQEIAQRQGISADYAAQLFRKLRNAGLLRGSKGPGGGYRLARESTKISAGDVVRAAEGPLAVVHCAIPGDRPTCSRLETCVTHLLWNRLSELIEMYLDSVSLADLCDQARRINPAEPQAANLACLIEDSDGGELPSWLREQAFDVGRGEACPTKQASRTHQEAVGKRLQPARSGVPTQPEKGSVNDQE